MSRHRLHVAKLDEFANYCASIGWMRVDPKGDYEVLRMTREGFKPLIVHTKLSTNAGEAPVHLTLHGSAEQAFSRYIRLRRAGKSEAPSSHNHGNKS